MDKLIKTTYVMLLGRGYTANMLGVWRYKLTSDMILPDNGGDADYGPDYEYICPVIEYFSR